MADDKAVFFVQKTIALTERDVERVDEQARRSGIGTWGVQARVLIREALDARAEQVNA